jgi:hypothetical protein
MRRLISLPFLALTVWTAWLGLLALMAAMLALEVWAPHFLPVTFLLALMVVAGLALIGGGLWRLLLGPGRVRALACLLIGVAPLLFFAGYFLWGLKAGYGRQIELNVPLKMLVPFGESVFDLLARFVYPVRTEGETVVMIAKPTPLARRQVDAMDRHVKTLWKRLGDRSTTRRVHWVRGPLLGLEGKAIYDICMGSPVDEPSVDAVGLSRVDRHEVAHCVLSSFLSTNVDPPALLTEGWAQANMGTDEAGVAHEAWEQWEQGSALSLRELTGPEWYGLHQWPVYVQGAALVNHILRVHGPAKFVKLYATSRRGFFADDCQRVLGVSIDELDVAYQVEVKGLVGVPVSSGDRLRGLTVRAPVTAAAWSTFLDEYLAGAARLVAPFEHARVTGEMRFSGSRDGKTEPTVHRFESRRSGRLRSLRIEYSEPTIAYLATPRESFEARRSSPGGPWVIEMFPKIDPDSAYRRILSRIETVDPVEWPPAILLVLSAEFKHRVDVSHIAVTKLERFEEGGHRFERVRVDDSTPAAHVPWRSVTVVLAADRHLAVRSEETDLGNGTTMSTESTFDEHEGLPVYRSSRNTIKGKQGVEREVGYKVLDRRFGPIPESEFTADRLLDGPVTRKTIDPLANYYKDPVTFADWYRVPALVGAISLVGGLGIGLIGVIRGRRRGAGPVDSAAGQGLSREDFS